MSIATTHKTHDRYTGGDLQSALSQSIHNKPKYHLRAGDMYLHMSCTKLTDQRDWAWVGTIDQARHARKRFDAAAGCKIRAVQSIPQHQEEDAL
jgi:hypothetical protein